MQQKNPKDNYKEKFYPLNFPRDEQKHDHIVEWWYFNGNLKVIDTGKEISYMDCLFAVKPEMIDIPIINKFPIKTLFFSHYLINNKKNFKQKTNPLCLVDKNSFSKPRLWINYDNSCLIEKRNDDVYHIVNDYIDLEMVSKKKPLLVDHDGFIDLKTKTSYYYSLTRLETKGIVKINKKWEQVEGLSWMDHQWAQTPLTEEDQWTWFSIQLDNGTDILCFEYGNKQRTCSLNIIDNNQKIYHSELVTITPKKKKYISKITKNAYDLEYHINSPELGLSLQTSPIKKDQEMIFGSINYWEGGIEIKGSIKGKEIKGKGFMELLPNPKNKKILKAISQELRKNSFLKSIKELTKLSTKSIYFIGEKIND
ncbi:MAG: lipocalin-like domain-containing protein [Minisyncoccus archaeiphilus]|uniref:lipocalin-like domain-containing protein n=1 Tax=Minisyncoccus archaeiphilus TaxID=3238481 RepID=UPI002B15C010|nr:MAG: lipocalin-like domain-containing protein [Candidatus Parcubacteria bacterium]